MPPISRFSRKLEGAAADHKRKTKSPRECGGLEKLNEEEQLSALRVIGFHRPQGGEAGGACPAGGVEHPVDHFDT